MAGTLQVNVVAADQEVFSGEASMVVAPTTDGEIGVLPGHIPLLSMLREGRVRVTLTDGSVVVAEANDGFLSVDGDVVSVVAGNARLVS